jgi:hypothetical protein
MMVPMDQTAALPAENYHAFLLVRRGVPLAGAVALLALGALDRTLMAWCLVGVVALLAEVRPTFLRGKDYLQLRRPILRWDALWVRALRPAARWFRAEEAWVLSFCAWNNHRVREALAGRKARRALVLLPHCVQMARCKADVQQDLVQCYQCGLCPVGDLLPAHLERGWATRITNRSHKAYQEARTYQPDLVVAVACHDRLLKGLTRLPQVPCFVIPLDLPHGMCVDTTFQVPHLLAAMEALVERKESEKVVPLRRDA